MAYNNFTIKDSGQEVSGYRYHIHFGFKKITIEFGVPILLFPKYSTTVTHQ